MQKLQILSAFVATKKGGNMDKISKFYEDHKKEIGLVAIGAMIYMIGYRKGYNNFKKILVDTCRTINDSITNF